jgi:hypothetical protein
MANALRDLFVRFRIVTDGAEKLKAVDKDVKSLTDSLKTLKRAVATSLGFMAVLGIKNWIEEQIRLGVELKRTAETLGLTTDEVQKYQYVATAMGLPVAQTAFAFRFFNRAVGEAALGTKSATKVFHQLGIKVKDVHGNVRPTDELLFEFSDHLKAIPDQATRTALAMRTLGRGGAMMLPLLQQGSAELREMFKDVTELGGGFDEAFVEKAAAVNREQKRLAMGWRTMAATLLKEVLPILQKWIHNSVDSIKVMIDYAKHTLLIRAAIYMLGAVLAGIVAWYIATKAILIATNPELAAAVAFWGLLAGALAFVYGVFEDFMVFMAGGDSLLGRMLDKIGGKGAALAMLHDLRDAMTAVKEAFTGSSDGAESLNQTFMKFLAESLPGIVKWGGTFAVWVVEAVDAAITGVRQLAALLGGVFSALTKSPKEGLADIKAGLQEATDIGNERLKRVGALDALEARFQQIGQRPAVHPAVPGEGPNQPNPADMAMDSDTGHRRGGADPLAPGNIAITVNNTIHGASDPKATADAVGKATKAGVKSGMSSRRDTYHAVTDGMPSTN